MSNNLNNMEFGPYSGDDIRISLLTNGFAVKGSNDQSYLGWDLNKDEAVEIPSSLTQPLFSGIAFLMPVSRSSLNRGDLIKDKGNFYFVSGKNTNNSLVVVDPFTGTDQTLSKISNLYGFDAVTKVCTMGDMSGGVFGGDIARMGMMAAMMNEGQSASQNPMVQMMQMQMMMGAQGQSGILSSFGGLNRQENRSNLKDEIMSEVNDKLDKLTKLLEKKGK